MRKICCRSLPSCEMTYNHNTHRRVESDFLPNTSAYSLSLFREAVIHYGTSRKGWSSETVPPRVGIVMVTLGGLPLLHALVRAKGSLMSSYCCSLHLTGWVHGVILISP